MSQLFRFAPLALCLSVLCAQEQPLAPKLPQPEKMEAAIIPVKTLSGDAFNRLRNMLNVFNNARISADDRLQPVIVYGSPDVIKEVRRVITELDKPGSEAAVGRNIELTLTFLKCSTKAAGPATTLPPDLEPVAKQLRAMTQYKDVQLWDIIPLRIQEGRRTEQSTRMPGSISPSVSPLAQITLNAEAVVTRETGRFVRFDRLQIGLKIPVVTGTTGTSPQFNYVEVGLNTAGDFKEGQKTVLGKLGGIDDDTAVFVVVALKVID